VRISSAWNHRPLRALGFIPHDQEYPVASTNAIDKAAAAFKKEEQRREGTKAMTEYLAAQAAEQKKTEKLRALRLAREAQEAETVVEKRPAKSKTAKATKAKKKLS
jgi:hypothetical protein